MEADRSGGSHVAAGISALSLVYVLFLQLGADFEQRFASSSLAAVVLLAVWLFLANARCSSLVTASPARTTRPAEGGDVGGGASGTPGNVQSIQASRS